MTKHFPKGLDGRMRDKNGEIRKKREDTLIGTLRKEYGADFAKGYDAEVQLGAVLRDKGVDSLDQFRKLK